MWEAWEIKNLTEDDKVILSEFFKNKKGNGYDFLAVLIQIPLYFLYLAFGIKFKNKNNPLDSNYREFCHELIVDGLLEIGRNVDVESGTDGAFITTIELYNSNYLKKIDIF